MQHNAPVHQSRVETSAQYQSSSIRSGSRDSNLNALPPPPPPPPSKFLSQYSAPAPPPHYSTAGPPSQYSAPAPPPHYSTAGPPSQYSAPAPPPHYSTAGPPSQYSTPAPPPYYSTAGPPSQFSTPNYAPVQSGPHISGFQSNPPSSGPPGDRLPPPVEAASSSGKSSGRVQKDHMPRPQWQLDADQLVYSTYNSTGPAASSSRRVPPSVLETGFISVDTGVCCPHFMRATTVTPSINKDRQLAVGVPLAVVASPFAVSGCGDESSPPLMRLDIASAASRLSGAGRQSATLPHQFNDPASERQCPIRCSRCMAYLNAFVQWQASGHEWVCNMCSMANKVPAWYYCSLDGSNNRVDKSEKPELCRGSVDIPASPEYASKPIGPEVLVFAIDISVGAVQSGVTTAAIRAVSSVLRHLQESNSSASFGVVTFDSRIHFYEVQDESVDPIRVRMSDSEDPVPPLPASSWILPVRDRLVSLQLLLQRIPELIGSLLKEPIALGGNPSKQDVANANSLAACPTLDTTRGNTFPRPPVNSFTCPTAVVAAIEECCRHSGARLSILTSSHSNVGLGKVGVREGVGLYGTDAEFFLYGVLPSLSEHLPDADPLKSTLTTHSSLSSACLSSNISVDIIVFSDGDDFKDIALLSEPCRLTGGSCILFNGTMSMAENVFRLESQLLELVKSAVATDVIVKLRTSVGLKVKTIIGPGNIAQMEEQIDLSVADVDSTFCFWLEHDGTLKDGETVYVQLAVLHTTLNGERRIRVHNLAFTASASDSVCFKGIDIDAVATILTKQAAWRALTHKQPKTVMGSKESYPDTGRFVQEIMVDMSSRYRLLCVSGVAGSKSQLILAEALRFLPLLCQGIIKHPAFAVNALTEASALDFRTLTCRATSRAYHLRRLLQLPSKDLMYTIYPRLFALHQFIESDCGASPAMFEGSASGRYESLLSRALAVGESVNETSLYRVPRSPGVSGEFLDGNGVYLMDDGLGTAFLYFGRQVALPDLSEWFGLTSKTDYPATLYPRPGSINGAKIWTVVELALHLPRLKPELVIVWGSNIDASYFKFAKRLIEDSYRGDGSYSDLLVYLHSTIMSKLKPK